MLLTQGKVMCRNQEDDTFVSVLEVRLKTYKEKVMHSLLTAWGTPS
jgi:hypothetical protein